MERRIINTKLQLRQTTDDNKDHYVEGYGFKYNENSRPICEAFVERILPGSLEGADMSDVKCYYNHDRNFLIGRSIANTLTYKNDEMGLFYSAKLPDTSYGRDLSVLLDRGDVRYSSFAFFAKEDKWTEEGIEVNGKTYDLREIIRFELIDDLSPVVDPAYYSSTSFKRSIEDLHKKHPGKGILDKANAWYNFRKRQINLINN